MTREYRIKENGFNEVKKRILTLIITASIVGVVISYFLNRHIMGEGVNTTIILLTTVVFAGILITITVTKVLKRQQETFNSYRLIIDEEKIIRQQESTPDIEIRIDEIESIKKNKSGDITINCGKINEAINVPSQLEKISDLELQLSEIKPIPENEPISSILTIVIAILTFLSIVVINLLDNKLFVGIGVIIISLTMPWSYIQIRRSKNIDPKIKKINWTILACLISFVGVAYIKIFR